MHGTAFPLILATSPASTSHATVGSNIGPGLPLLLAALVIGCVVYRVRRRRGRGGG
jgi:phosphate/sulfate permease